MWNERCDIIATSFADEKSLLLFSGSLEDYEKVLGSKISDIKMTKEKSKTTIKTKNSKQIKGAGYSYISFVDGKYFYLHRFHLNHTL